MTTALKTYNGLFIGGDWSTKDRHLVDVINPATEDVFTQIPLADLDDAEQAVAAAVRLHAEGTWWRSGHDHRVDVLRRIAAGIEAHQDEFARAYIEDQGGVASFAPLVVGEAARAFRRQAQIAAAGSHQPEKRSGNGGDGPM